MRVNELFLETKKKKRGRREKWGLFIGFSRCVVSRCPREEKKKRENKIVLFEEKENELKRRKEKAGN